MKQILLLLISVTGFSQSMSLTENVTIGQNCGNGPVTDYPIPGDLNLNGFTLTLRNVNLQISGNLNGSGQIVRCGNYDHSNVCVTGVIQNGVVLGDLTCSTLSTDEFVLTTSNYGLKYTIYSVTGERVARGFTNEDMFLNMPVNTVLILKVEGFLAKKLILE
jgi:hypothetical protein